MKTAAILVALCASLASAGIVITPVFANQVVPKTGGDCFYGETTPHGCAYVAAPQNEPVAGGNGED